MAPEKILELTQLFSPRGSTIQEIIHDEIYLHVAQYHTKLAI
jgi:hypothetical protein